VLGNVKSRSLRVHDAGDNSILKMVALPKASPLGAAKLAIFTGGCHGDKHEIEVEFVRSCHARLRICLTVADVL